MCDKNHDFSQQNVAHRLGQGRDCNRRHWTFVGSDMSATSQGNGRGSALLTGALMVLVLGGCQSFPGVEADLRRLASGPFSTDTAKASQRPPADSRGVITYPGYQVVVARQGDTVTRIAQRLGLNAASLARHNAIKPDAVLNAGALIALPGKIGAAQSTGGRGNVSDPYAGQGVRQPAVPPTTSSSASAKANSAQTGDASLITPKQHRVKTGETAWSIARKYGISIQELASLNGLDANMTIRTGQPLLIPQNGTAPKSADNTVSAPGQGSKTPEPPSASTPLPDEKTAPASTPAPKTETPDLGATRTAASGSGRLMMPVAGAITRAYLPGTNEGIDISAPAGTAVKAADAGRVAAITRDVNGVPIIVIRHKGDLMTVYTGLDALRVKKGDDVTRGQVIGTSGQEGSVHFEVRRGFESTDPEPYLG